jgi:hypothetical protein
MLLNLGLIMANLSPAEITGKITAFLQSIGLPVRLGTVAGPTILPGITVESGVLIYDPERLLYPGDLLHEAGHLAVKPGAERQSAQADLGADPAEEMMAISWSYAAALHIGLPPEVVFHPAGYRGGSASLLENFAAGHYFAVPMLQWLGLTYDERQAQICHALPFPAMRAWLREQ